MNDPEQFRQDVFRQLQEAELNESYYRMRASTYRRLDAAVRILSSIASAGAVAALLAKQPYALSALTVVTLIATTANNVLGLGELAHSRRELAVKWSAVTGRLHPLLKRIEYGAGELTDLLDIMEQGERLQNEDAEPRHEREALAAHARVRARWGTYPATPTGTPPSP